MPPKPSSAPGLTEPVIALLRAQLPAAAGHTVAAIITEVPGYARALGGPMGARIEQAVQMALGEFLKLASGSQGTDPGSPLGPALDGAYALGRDEARSGRTMDALLAAYRVGARVAWRELAAIAVAAHIPAETMAQFAELVFAYIDELSAASVSGHADQLASTGRVRQRYLDRLTRSLLAGDPADVVRAAADRAQWVPPGTLTAVVLPAAHVRGLRSLTDPQALALADDLPGADAGDDTVVLLVPHVDAAERGRLKRSLAGRRAVLGPARPWTQARVSYQRALRARSLGAGGSAEALDTEEHLSELVAWADPEALADLRAQVLAPLAAVRASTAGKLTETLRAWLLHQGRRDDVAAALFVHPQTVRYRVGQLRSLYGDRLEDPDTVLAASIALGTGAPGAAQAKAAASGVRRSTSSGPARSGRETNTVRTPRSASSR